MMNMKVMEIIMKNLVIITIFFEIIHNYYHNFYNNGLYKIRHTIIHRTKAKRRKQDLHCLYVRY